VPAGPRVAILTNAGGPGILAADACDARGLVLPRLSEETTAALRAFLPPSAALSNPVDMLATAAASDYARAIPIVLRDPSVDSLLTIFIPPFVTDAGAITAAIAHAGRQATKPMVAAFPGAEGMASPLAPVPCYRFAESAAHALGRAAAYGLWRTQPPGEIPALPRMDVGAARSVVQRVVSGGAGWLSSRDATALLQASGVDVAPVVIVEDERSAVDAAARLGFPVALKGASTAIVHKTEAHAVRTALADAGAVRGAYRELAARLGADVEEILLQPMVCEGAEFFVGVLWDATFGHAVLCGAGGIMIEVFRDVACRLHRSPTAMRPRWLPDCAVPCCSTASGARPPAASPRCATSCCACPRCLKPARRSWSSISTR
jgi:acyl-CoA synthetase (NDP forming)